MDNKYLVVADLMGEDDANREEYSNKEEFHNDDRRKDPKEVSFFVQF